MKSYLDMILSLKKEILKLKNKLAYSKKKSQRDRICESIATLEKTLSYYERIVLPFINQLEPLLRGMVETSYLEGKDFSIGVQTEFPEEFFDMEFKKELKKEINKGNTHNALLEDEIELRVQKRIYNRYYKNLVRACEYWNTN